MSTPYPVPILGPDGKIDPSQVPAVPPSDAATAELVNTAGTATRTAVQGVLGTGVVTTTALTTALAPYARATDLAALATDAELAGKQDRLPFVYVRYNPTTGWTNPTPPAGGWRVFDSVEWVQAPSPPSLTGVNRDEWKAHPDSPARAA